MPTSRREFLLSASAATLTPCAPALRAQGATVDVVIRGGTVFDGSLTATGIEADVALNAGRVVRIGRRLAETGRLEVDAKLAHTDRAIRSMWCCRWIAAGRESSTARPPGTAWSSTPHPMSK